VSSGGRCPARTLARKKPPRRRIQSRRRKCSLRKWFARCPGRTIVLC